MSRALDPQFKAGLLVGDHTIVYQCVANVLATRYNELLDIEVLGSSHALPPSAYFLQDQNSIAIPKINIIRAFLPAYKVIRAHLDGRPGALEELQRATSAILLLDPEHMTAANIRKRCIQGVDENDGENLYRRIDAELYFIDSLVTSRLHRHTKSPTLWGHRQWLMDLWRKRQRPISSLATVLEKLIFVSAERHPRNYYAWCHARYLLGEASRSSQEEMEEDCGGDGGRQQQDNEAAEQKEKSAMEVRLETATELVKKWCFGHPNDISGWSFLMVLVQQLPQTKAAAIFSETLRLAEAFSWRGESVWYFARSMLRMRSAWPGTAWRDEFERVLVLVHRKKAEPGALDKQILRNMLS